MGIFSRRPPPTVIAHPLEFAGAGVYEMRLDENYGLVFEDNNETGYLYVTNANFSEVFDALHLYDRGDPAELKEGVEAFIVWSPELQRAGVYYGGKFQAGVDFVKRVARCRTGFPQMTSTPWKSDHQWKEDVVRGLEP